MARVLCYCYLLILLSVLQMSTIEAWGGSDSRDKVLLEKVTAITLEEGKQTNARRTSPIPQLECVGGSAGCHGYRPRVVQCRNVGFDGYDVQWECKTEMDSKYRFGKIDVSCEGYEYPDDPYVLRGSCGLRYHLDLTDEGHRAKRNSFYGSNEGQYQQQQYSNRSSSSWFGTIIQLLVIGAIIYCCLGACFRSGGRNTYGNSGGSTYGYSDSYNRGSGGPGFWSGAATGGALGYLFGSRNTGRPYGSGWGYGSGWNSGGGWSSGGGGLSRSSSSSSSSRTTSGFGGTSRR